MSVVQRARIELSAGGVIYRGGESGSEILLINDSYGNWGFPKGHLEEGEGPREAALRECQEETGLTRLEVVRELGATDWHFRAGNELVHKFCDYYLFEADREEPATPQHSEGIGAVAWLAPDEALSRVTYANARHILKRALTGISRARPSRPARGK